MWTRKSDLVIQEILVKERRMRSSLLRPLGSAVILSTICLVLYSLGLRACASGVVVLSNTPARFDVRFVIVSALTFLILFGIAVYRQRLHGGLFAGGRIMMCVACKESQHAQGSMRCLCGGALEPFDNFDWISDTDDEEQSAENTEGQ